MMQGLDAEIVAENVVSVLKHRPVKFGLRLGGPKAVMVGLMRKLLTVMPTASSDALVAACNRLLDGLPSTDNRHPWVEAVDLVGGGVPMREGKRVNALKGHSDSGLL